MMGRIRQTGRSGASPIERASLYVVAAFSAAAVVGFATFGRHPQLLENVPSAIPFFAVSFRVFSVGQILLAAGALILLLVLRAPARWMLALIAVYFISLASELSGTAVGFPFGPYHYTPVLGPKWFDLVPLVIPLSWFMMAIPSYWIAAWMDPKGGITSRILLGSLLLTAWDLALDPAMSYATFYWRWEVAGPYYGMPWMNLFGWMFTSALIMGALLLLRSEVWLRDLPGRWMLGFYAINILLPLGMAAAAGLMWAVVATVVAYLAIAGGSALHATSFRSSRAEVG